MAISRATYTVLFYALLPWVVARLALRGLRQPAYLKHIPERLGVYTGIPTGPVIWLHAVSLGETRASQPLIRLLQDRYPGYRILTTHMTPTGRAASQELFGASVMRSYLPYDYPAAVRRFLDHFRPSLGILLETEIWPNLIHECKRRNLPVLLVNARLSERSAHKYQRYSAFMRTVLGELTSVAAQTDADASRLTQLGAPNVGVFGNLKFDLSVPDSQRVLADTLRGSFGASRPVWVAASTRDGEEARVLDVLDQVAVPDLLTVLVPRHPQRFETVGALLRNRGIRFQRRSSNEHVAPDTRVVLGDSMGEMFAYYAACDVAFVGGSLVPHGGQNLLEACAVGTPVLIGPHTFNFDEATQKAVDAGAAIRVRDAEELAAQLNGLLLDAHKRKSMGEAGLTFVRQHQGAAQRLLECIIAVLSPPKHAPVCGDAL